MDTFAFLQDTRQEEGIINFNNYEPTVVREEPPSYAEAVKLVSVNIAYSHACTSDMHHNIHVC